MKRMNIALLSEELEFAALPEEQAGAANAAIDAMAEDGAEGAVETAELALELDEIEGALDEGIETAEVVEEVAAKAEEANANGGLDPVAAEAISLALNHLCARVGVAPKANVSMEGFKAKATRVRQTTIAVEGWKETAKQIIAYVVKAFNSAVEWIKKFVAAVMSRAENLRQKGEKLAALAKSKAGAELDKDVVINLGAGVAGALTTEDQTAVEPAAVVKGLEEHFSEVAVYNNALSGSVFKAHAADVNAAVEKLDKAEEFQAAILKFTKLEEGVEGTKTPRTGWLSKVGLGKLPEGYVDMTSVSFLGRVAAVTTVADAGATYEQAEAGLSSLNMRLVARTDAKELKDTEKVAPLSLEQIRKVGEHIAQHFGTYKEIEQSAKATEAEFKSLITKLGKIEGKEGEQAAKNRSTLIKAANALAKLSTGLRSSLYGHDVKVGGAAYTYAVKSLKAYGVKAEEKKEETK